MIDIREVLLVWFINFLTKKYQVAVISLCQVNKWQMNFISKFLKKNLKKVYTSFKDNIWGPDLADMHLVSKYNYA